MALTVATSALLLLGAVAAPADAHTPQKWRKARHHVKKRSKKQIGAPYVYGGTSPSGFDCSGLTSWVFENHGATLPHSSQAQFELAGGKKYKRVWKRRKLRAGDLVFFKTTGARVGHAGIYVGNDRFVSATTSSGVRKDSVYDPYYWGPRWVGATRTRVTIRFKS